MNEVRQMNSTSADNLLGYACKTFRCFVLVGWRLVVIAYTVAWLFSAISLDTKSIHTYNVLRLSLCMWINCSRAVLNLSMLLHILTVALYDIVVADGISSLEEKNILMLFHINLIYYNKLKYTSEAPLNMKITEAIPKWSKKIDIFI